MLNITFTQRSAFDLSCIPEQWREYVTVMRVPFINSVGTVEERSLPPMYYTRVTIAVQPDDSSYRYRALMQARQLVLKFALPFFFEFPVGSSVVYDGQTYYVKRPEDIKKQGEKNIEYSMTLSADDANLGDYKMRNSVDGRLKWSMCAKPHEFIEEIVKNLNEREGADKWKVGTCLESSEKTVEFNHTYLDAALADIATAFETEYEITPDCYIHLRKVEYNGDDPLPLSYGRGNGFVPGVGRTSEVGGEPVKRLYVQGTDRNIDRSTYGDLLGLNDKPGELLLPLNQEIEHEGRTYRSDYHGYYIERVDEISTATKEDSLDCSEIYPSRIGKCTNLIATDPAKNWYDFVDDTIPANLDFNSYLIAGETMTVIFQTGMLSGNDREFEVKYYHDSVNGKPARRFEITPQEIDGITMPNETFKPKFGEDGDTYAVFGIQLPPEYICNNDDKSGASWDMMREAARKLHDCEEQKFTFTGEMQSMWAKRNWEQIGGKIVVGGYVWFTDNQFAPDGTAIRIVGIKDYLTKPYAPTIELSNAIASPGSVSNSLRQIDNTEVVIDDTKKSIIRYTKRRFRDALETIGMLEDAQLENFNSAISPVAIQTMAMLVGDESLQFLMGKTIATIGSGDWGIEFADNALTAPTGYLRHMTIGVNSITANREMVDYYTWQMPKMNLTPKSGAKYYLYAVVNRTGFTFNESLGANICNAPGTWLLSETSHKIDENTGTYHLLVGVLNSEYNGERSFATLYGFTEILPGRMTTDLIISNDGKTYMNLATGEICGNIKFLSENDEYITIIEGGKIKSELLDVSQIIARSVIVGEPGKQRVEITPSSEGNGSVKIFDEDDNEVTVFEGQTYASINDLYDSSSGGDCEMLARTSQQYGYGAGVTLGRGEAAYHVPVDGMTGSIYGTPVQDTIVISKPWYTSAPTEIIIKQGHLHAYASAVSVNKPQTGSGTSVVQPIKLSSASAYVYVRIDTYNDETMQNRINSANVAVCTASASCQMMAETYPGEFGGSNVYPGQSKDSGIMNIAGKKVKVPAGWHRLVLWVYCTAQVSGSRAEVDWGFTSGSRNDIMAEYRNDSYVSRFFANGFCLGTRSDNYVMAVKTASNNMNFLWENNGYGFRMTENGIEYRLTDGTWKKLT